MAIPRWRKSNTSVHNVSYHLIWCPKYRRSILIDDIEKRLEELLKEKAKEHNWNIKQMEIMPDHVHIFIQANPVDAPHYIVQQLKGFTSNILRKEFPSLKSRLPTLWTRSYYCESVGHISEDTVKKYIKEQKNNEKIV